MMIYGMIKQNCFIIRLNIGEKTCNKKFANQTYIDLFLITPFAAICLKKITHTYSLILV
jgi:hypothetical protein